MGLVVSPEVNSSGAAVNDLRPRLAAAIPRLSDGLLQRDVAIRLALLALLAGEHLLLIGPPGTAKSQLARRLHKLLADGRYFERLLTRFSVPEELFGPLSIGALEDDRYERRVDGYLPTAAVAFIDEVFKANSAILNALLTLLNEREFDNGDKRMVCPLLSAIGATNEVPDDELGAAFLDRFLLRHRLTPVGREAFPALIGGIDAQVDIPVDLRLQVAELADLATASARVELTADVADLLLALRDHVIERGIYVSDRRWRKVVRLMKISACADGRTRVSVWDGWLLQYCLGHQAAQEEDVAEWYARRLGVFETLDPQRFRRVVEGFEAQLELEQNAGELDYNSDGRLAMFDRLADGKHGEAALRMPAATKRRTYGELHVQARAGQVEQLIAEVDAYRFRLTGLRQELQAIGTASLWWSTDSIERLDARLAADDGVVVALRDRLAVVRAGFLGLPRKAGANPVDPLPSPMITE